MGVAEPQATFSPCFDGLFRLWRPAKYAELLATKTQQHKAHDWLVSTDWSGGVHGVAARMELKLTREMINVIHSGELGQAKAARDSVFGFERPDRFPAMAHSNSPRFTTLVADHSH